MGGADKNDTFFISSITDTDNNNQFNNYRYFGHGLYQKNDGGYIVLTNYDKTTGANDAWSPTFIEYNSNGDVIKAMRFDWPGTADIQTASRACGNFLYDEATKYIFFVTQYSTSKLILACLDWNTDTIVWQKDIGQTQGTSAYIDVFQAADSDYIMLWGLYHSHATTGNNDRTFAAKWKKDGTASSQKQSSHSQYSGQTVCLSPDGTRLYYGTGTDTTTVQTQYFSYFNTDSGDETFTEYPCFQANQQYRNLDGSAMAMDETLIHIVCQNYATQGQLLYTPVNWSTETLAGEDRRFTSSIVNTGNTVPPEFDYPWVRVDSGGKVYVAYSRYKNESGFANEYSIGILKFNTDGTILWHRGLRYPMTAAGDSSAYYVKNLEITKRDNIMLHFGATYLNATASATLEHSCLAVLPSDGSLTGTYGPFVWESIYDPTVSNHNSTISNSTTSRLTGAGITPQPETSTVTANDITNAINFPNIDLTLNKLQ